MLGLGLYWGEGYKRGTNTLGFTNSDPNIIHLYIQWLEECLGVVSTELVCRVSINVSHKNREKQVVRYWSSVTRIPTTQFTKTSFITTTSKKVYTNTNEHFGTLRIKVRKSSKLYHATMGALAHIAKTVSAE